MNAAIRAHLDNVYSTDHILQNDAFQTLIDITDQPVDWAYEAWDELVEGLTHKDNHVRAICAQVLNNLAKSDPQERMLKTLPALINVTKDERFVTARHCMQSLWKVGAAGENQRKKLLQGLEVRFKECIKEKNGTLIRYDILECLRNVYDATGDEKVKTKALAWIQLEADEKYRKKYSILWKK